MNLDVEHAKQLLTIVKKCLSEIDPSDSAKLISERLPDNFHIAKALESYGYDIQMSVTEMA